LVHSKDEPLKIKNSNLFINALEKFGIPYATTFNEQAGHGYRIINPLQK
jgi:hypothetical protein